MDVPVQGRTIYRFAVIYLLLTIGYDFLFPYALDTQLKCFHQQVTKDLVIADKILLPLLAKAVSLKQEFFICGNAVASSDIMISLRHIAKLQIISLRGILDILLKTITLTFPLRPHNHSNSTPVPCCN